MAAASGASTTDFSTRGGNDASLVGGIVGGVLGLLLIGTLALFIVLCHRKHTRKVRPDAHEPRAPAMSEFWGGPGLTMKGPNGGLLYVSHCFLGVRSDCAGTLSSGLWLQDITDPRTYPARMDTQGGSSNSVSSTSSGGHGRSVAFPLGRGVANAGYRGCPQI